jgi:hypothetical protein
MYFCQELMPLFFGDAPLQDSCGAFFVKLALMDLVCFRAPNYTSCLLLVLRELLLSEIGEQRFWPGGNYGHDFMGGRCFLECGAANDVVIELLVRVGIVSGLID